MPMKKILKKLVRIGLVLIILILSLLLLINIPIINFVHNQTEEDYSNWMSDVLDEDQLIIDVAMLGAHDIFSNNIDIFSELDPFVTDTIMQGFTGFLVKGFIVKQSVTQISTAEDLLKSGVRYFDIRLSFYEDNWYTKHNYISEDFSLLTPQIIQFLEDNTGEFLILDFQHISGLDYNSLEDYLSFKQMLDDNGLLDYAYITDDPNTVTYGDITNNKTESKVIIISKFAESENDILYYNETIRSNWADSDDFDYVIEFLEEEADYIEAQDLDNRFRVMQAVTTMQMNGSGILKALMNWSLINRAKSFNSYLINYENFESLLDDLPIVMVDYSNSNKNSFNENIMQIIMDFNQNS